MGEKPSETCARAWFAATVMAMAHYDYTSGVTDIWQAAVDRYRAGRRGADQLLTAAETAALAAIGVSAQEMYDYAEDFVGYGEPTLATVIAEVDARRAYFLEVQGGQPSGQQLRSEDLPPKSAAAHGLTWLPRIVPKARAKLRGELPPETMYGCGGDRQFLREHDIHPAELLHAVWRAGDDDEAVYAWVLRRSNAKR